MFFFAPAAAAAASLLSRKKKSCLRTEGLRRELERQLGSGMGGGSFCSLSSFSFPPFLLPLSNVVFAACEMCFCFDFGRSRGEEGDGAGVKGTRIWKRKKRWRQEEGVVYTGGFFFTSTAAACTPPRRGGTSALLLVSFPAPLLFTEN